MLYSETLTRMPEQNQNQERPRRTRPVKAAKSLSV
jgi:hypothetical protein